jgi:gliding motility-associated-like protein
MRFKCASTLGILLTSLSGLGQSSAFSPFVFSSSGTVYEDNSFYTSATIGQVFYETYVLSDFALTQGFQQPEGTIPDTIVSYTVEYHECDHMYHIQVDTALICSSGMVTYTWNGVPGDSIYASSSTLIELLIETDTGCSWTETIELDQTVLEVIPCPLTFYSLITPNNDGDNDGWIIENIDQDEFAKNTVVILNRWGNEVWKAENYDNDNVLWTGISEGGQPLPDGTYFYSVDTHSLSFRGYVELQR